MHYEKSALFSGSASSVLSAAIDGLTHNGFALVEKQVDSARLTGPGMNSTKQNPLVGATDVCLTAAESTLHISAELGGVRRMKRFLDVFPFALCLAVGMTLFCVGAFVRFPFVGQNGWTPLGLILLPASPWLVLSPLMGRWIENRTIRALDVLVGNAVQKGAPA